MVNCHHPSHSTIRQRLRVALALLCAIAPGAAVLQAQNPPSSFRVDVRTIEVPLTVLDPAGNVVLRLRPEDFHLREDGETQRIRSLTLDTQRVNVVMLLDLSRSVREELKNIKRAAKRFIDELGDEDRVAVIAFSREVELVQAWTTDKRKLRRAIDGLKAGTYTQLYDAIQLAVSEYLTDVPDKKAIVLITDGVDAISETSFKKLQQSILRHQASIYIVSLLNSVKADISRYRRVAYVARAMARFGEPDYLEKFFEAKEREMSLLASYTGGRAFYPKTVASLESIYGQVARELKSQFLLTYIPSNTGAGPDFREITLSYVQPGCELLYRRGYFLN